MARKKFRRRYIPYRFEDVEKGIVEWSILDTKQSDFIIFNTTEESARETCDFWNLCDPENCRNQ